ncbi:MAG: hypothetical protein WC829_11395 [Hyphomicrobium sp.]|jgi:hypothetical protein
MKAKLANVRTVSSGVTRFRRTQRFGNLWLMTAAGLLADADRSTLRNGATLLIDHAGGLLVHPLGLPVLPAGASVVAQIGLLTDDVWLAQKLRAAVESRLIGSALAPVR